MRRPPLSLGLVVLTCMLAPDAASAFDTGPHSDISRDALTAEGFGDTAVDVANVDNWFVDLYSNASKIPQSGHSTIGKGILGSLLGPRENWPDNVVKAAARSHFDSGRDDIFNAERAQKEWDRLMRNTLSLAFDARVRNKPLDLLTAIGMSLHELEDFYSHSNWIEQQGLEGVDGTDWSKLLVRPDADLVRRPGGEAGGPQRLHRRDDGARAHARRLEHRRQQVDEGRRQQGLAGAARLRERLHDGVLRDPAVGARAPDGARRRAVLEARAALRRPVRQLAEPRPARRPGHRDDVRPLVRRGRAVQPRVVAEHLRLAQRPRRRPDRPALRDARLLRGPLQDALPAHVRAPDRQARGRRAADGERAPDHLEPGPAAHDPLRPAPGAEDARHRPRRPRSRRRRHVHAGDDPRAELPVR